jgi:hypothetical protein
MGSLILLERAAMTELPSFCFCRDVHDVDTSRSHFLRLQVSIYVGSYRTLHPHAIYKSLAFLLLSQLHATHEITESSLKCLLLYVTALTLRLGFYFFVCGIKFVFLCPILSVFYKCILKHVLYRRFCVRFLPPIFSR